MLHTYIKIALRSLWKHRAIASINVAGLAVALACCVLMMLFVRDEWTHDTFHEHANDLYRVTMRFQQDGQWSKLANTAGALGPVLKEEIPQIEQVTRITHDSGTVRRDGEVFSQILYFADPSMLVMFTFPLVSGNAATALSRPDGVVLSTSMARKLFGSTDPLGRSIDVRLGTSPFFAFTVTGVLAPIPANSSLNFDVLLPYQRLRDHPTARAYSDSWGFLLADTYVWLQAGTSPETVDEALRAVGKRHAGLDGAQLHLQPLTDVYLDPSVRGMGITRVGNPTLPLVLLTVALMLLFVAGVNYTSLAVARSTQRVREVGMRKVLGAGRRQLMFQFWGEAVLTSFLALGLGLALAELLLPTFNRLFDVHLELDYLSNPTTLPLIVGMALFVGFVAGIYPALMLSGQQPASVLKHRARVRGGGRTIRVLLVVQSTIAVGLIAGTLVMRHQLRYMQTADLGFVPDDVVSVLAYGVPPSQRSAFYQLVTTEASSHPEIVSITGMSGMMGRSHRYTKLVAGTQVIEDATGYDVDPSLKETIQLRLKEGHFFAPNQTNTDVAVVNEAFLRAFGWTTAVGRQIEHNDAPVTIVGIVRDFHMNAFQMAIEPLILRPRAEPPSGMLVRSQPGRRDDVVAFLKEKWLQVAPEAPFNSYFMEDDLRAYDRVTRWSTLVRDAALLAIVIAALGLFGLNTLATVRRSKEIGIRKVLGASIRDVVVLLSAAYVRLTLLSSVLAAPLAYVVMERWLQNFAYHIEPRTGTFVAATLVALATALVAVGLQSFRAARANPVAALRYE